MRALGKAVVDVIWAAVEPLVARPPDGHPLGCHRPRVCDRLCLRGIIWRLVLGCSWESVEILLDHAVSDTTLRSRRDEWVAAGVFDQIADEIVADMAAWQNRTARSGLCGAGFDAIVVKALRQPARVSRHRRGSSRRTRRLGHVPVPRRRRGRQAMGHDAHRAAQPRPRRRVGSCAAGKPSSTHSPSTTATGSPTTSSAECGATNRTEISLTHSPLDKGASDRPPPTDAT